MDKFDLECKWMFCNEDICLKSIRIKLSAVNITIPIRCIIDNELANNC